MLDTTVLPTGIIQLLSSSYPYNPQSSPESYTSSSITTFASSPCLPPHLRTRCGTSPSLLRLRRACIRTRSSILDGIPNGTGKPAPSPGRGVASGSPTLSSKRRPGEEPTSCVGSGKISSSESLSALGTGLGVVLPVEPYPSPDLVLRIPSALTLNESAGESSSGECRACGSRSGECAPRGVSGRDAVRRVRLEPRIRLLARLLSLERPLPRSASVGSPPRGVRAVPRNRDCRGTGGGVSSLSEWLCKACSRSLGCDGAGV